MYFNKYIIVYVHCMYICVVYYIVSFSTCLQSNDETLVFTGGFRHGPSPVACHRAMRSHPSSGFSMPCGRRFRCDIPSHSKDGVIICHDMCHITFEGVRI